MSASTKKAPALIAGNETLGVIGAGVMGRTLLRGLFDSGVLSRDSAWASSRSKETCDAAAEELGIPVVTDCSSRVPDAGLILICVKPRQIAGIAASLKAAGLKPGTLLISVLAGTTVEQLESLLGTENPWVRAMPNTPCVVREGMTAICGGTHATAEHLAKAQLIFESVGTCLAVDEGYFNAITALSGSGPAFQYLIMEAFADAGVRVGLPRHMALTLVAQTAIGAARMVQSSGRHPAALRDDVTTPAGCTIGGLLMLEDGKIRSVLARAIEEATKIAGGLGAAATAQKEKRHG
jgi:pyrroline-5-carboxylate reductase